MRVKAATQCCRWGWGELPQNLGTPLGTTWGQLNWPVGKPCCVHRGPGFSTAASPGGVDKKWLLTSKKEVIHGIHNTYYYYPE